VHDSSTALPVIGHVAPLSDRGHGLRLVQRLSDAWGIHRTSDGKTVWFELHDRDAAELV
jgi:hypothetical protein